MIQRIQTVYLAVVIAMLILASFIGNFFEIVTDEARFKFTAFGIEKHSLDGNELISTESFLVVVFLAALALFAVVVMMSYKKLAQQFRYARLLWGLYLLLLIGVACWFYFLAPSQVSGKEIASNFGASFYLLVIGLPFTHFAYMGIGKDKKTIDSLNRLR